MSTLTITLRFDCPDRLADDAVANDLASDMLVQAEDYFEGQLSLDSVEFGFADESWSILDNDGDWWFAVGGDVDDWQPARVGDSDDYTYLGVPGSGLTLRALIHGTSGISSAATVCETNRPCNYSGQDDQRDGTIDGQPAYFRLCKHCGQPSVRVTFGRS